MSVPDRLRTYRKIIRLRRMTAFIWGIGTLVYTTMIWYTSERDFNFNPFVMLIPSSVMLAFAVNAFERRCPKCHEKFYGDLFRFLSKKACQSCNYQG